MNDGELARVARLPKWAQDRIKLLESNVVHLERQLATGPADSNAFLNPYSESPTPLGKNPVVAYGPHGDLKEFTVQFKDGELTIQGLAPSYTDYLAVLPQSGNQVLIKHLRKDG